MYYVYQQDIDVKWYFAVLKALIERQVESMGLKSDDAGADDDAGGESKKRYLLLISTVMSWAGTKPLDPV